jgi:hypothetical protein
LLYSRSLSIDGESFMFPFKHPFVALITPLAGAPPVEPPPTGEPPRPDQGLPDSGPGLSLPIFFPPGAPRPPWAGGPQPGEPPVEPIDPPHVALPIAPGGPILWLPIFFPPGSQRPPWFGGPQPPTVPPEQIPGMPINLPAQDPEGSGWVYAYVPGYGWMWAQVPAGTGGSGSPPYIDNRPPSERPIIDADFPTHQPGEKKK